MKIAYVTTYDSSDQHYWSGSGTSILTSLRDSGFQVEAIDNLKARSTLFFRMKKVFYSKLFSKNYLRDREPALSQYYASQVESALASTSCDLVFSPGTIPIAYLRIPKPVVFWGDSTFAGMVNFYPSFTNLCSETLKNGNKLEQMALSSCRLAIYSSEWAANTALENYEVDQAKVKVVPFGANFSSGRDLQAINSIIQNKSFEPCKLLFLGVDWLRKGGDIALKVADLLNRSGMRTELHVAGCQPPGRLPDYVKQHGYLSMDAVEGRQALESLMLESHFLILPSKAECYGVVFAEASSFGLPSLATHVGGIPTAVHDGKNGQTFPPNTPPERYCEVIAGLMASKQAYVSLALSSFNEYTKRLNWATAGRRVKELIQENCD